MKSTLKVPGKLFSRFFRFFHPLFSGFTDISEYGSDQRELELLEDAKTHIITSTSSMKTVTDYEIEPDDYEEIEDILTERVKV